jgi:uncharacterized protein YbjT (DUF2867 family)
MPQRNIFITGGTGYMGQHLIPVLLNRGHQIRALVRRGREAKLPPGCAVITGDPLDKITFAGHIRPADTFVQLVGVPRPSPAKARQFREVDLVSVRESVEAATEAGIKHFVYVSVAHPAPIMKAYIAVRRQAEALIRAKHLNATILRPWYVLGPGHRWPYLLWPVYWICERVPQTRETAGRLGLVKLEQMIGALVEAIESPCEGTRIMTVPDIRRCQRAVEPAVGATRNRII